ncbi:hypothetical protein M427DRAFT_161218 [Gonapodya prolifera JEL478]|uniref:FAD/NAD(P)-binding domain-containing protein n=1 Tax=Gonapodya prolifera (strain JEL478) TaxID=1344416 RepID=A0A138ZX06_GONPJ|nr:hypothetical protein M427DRAFT_161218 [Gonapodya prolifera JEL478]|eukprot:KXS08991.1 hypothetical protein M427DRAFT_161218 [Gonapodya prolifera JEL478]
MPNRSLHPTKRSRLSERDLPGSKSSRGSTIFQRTPACWVMPPGGNFVYTAQDHEAWKADPEKLRSDAEKRSAAFESLFPSMKTGSFVNYLLTRVSAWYMWYKVKDANISKLITPDFVFGCRRPCAQETFLDALNQPNVTLETNSITKIVPEGIVAKDGLEHKFDAIVFATGYTLSTFPPFELRGVGGQTLQESWKDGKDPVVFHGLMTRGFPNYMMIGMAHFTVGSAMWNADAHVSHAVNVLKHFVSVSKSTNPTSQIVQPSLRAQQE